MRSLTRRENLPSWGIQGFEFHDVLENKTYEIGVDDLKIPVTTKEVLDFYPAEHRLKETDIEQYAAAYTARIKAYREYTRQLDATLVRRLLDEERLMKVGESDGFPLETPFRLVCHFKAGERKDVRAFQIRCKCLLSG